MTESLKGELEGFAYRFEPGGDAAPPLLLLHGTGGDENDLIPLGRELAPGRALLSPRGRVLEAGMPRFFRRLAEGVFDEADLVAQAAALAGFVTAARQRHGLAAPVALGFSNGANIAAALLLLHPDLLAGAALLRAMPPLRQPPAMAIPGTKVLLLSGSHDPIVPAAGSAALAATLSGAGAQVTHHNLPAGHGLTRMDLALAQKWLEAQAKATAPMG
ncbi:alpha/beta hydrolase [Pseudoroseomonas cervicalis]|uniref:alpha/beta hydrolase n=1 Tax=Teichococcus cervicalis TaxID=204525 RepID=UPI00277F46A4|nr:alpha/beta hydrolase [Pseudoroseomonas cervicalis]MDQ1077634.1 phospholipase/carboxylesterase [Pseudoroseomonas cervicalis]